jgi:Uri superfamily endonuclease
LGRDRPVTYQLHISVARSLSLSVGRLGHYFFPAGNYVYTGSARRHLEARIARHLRDEKTLRWHIDWLLTAPGVCVVAVTRSKFAECALNQRTGGRTLARGFGASDCRKRCESHLMFLGEERLARANLRRRSRQFD